MPTKRLRTPPSAGGKQTVVEVAAPRLQMESRQRLPFPVPGDTTEPTRRTGDTIRRLIAAFAAFYLLASALVLFRLGDHPGFAYNWEAYTAWRFFPFWDNPSDEIFDLTDGLMADSGILPFVTGPAWLGFTIGGVGLTALRAPIALIAALAVPLTWLVGRRIATPSAAIVTTLLLATSPAYLTYARTATVVGISLPPALLAIYALLRVLQTPRSWRWLTALNVLLILNSYGYAVLRFLWPIALVLLAGEVLWRRGERRWLLTALAITLAALPAALVLLDQLPGYDPREAIRRYYNGRGEQVLALNDDPEGYKHYLDAANGEVEGSATELALRLVEENARDLGNLLLDRGTTRALTDFWNPHGRLYPWFLVPFFALGTAASLWRMRRQVEDRALQGLFWGFSLPLLLTSQVHIGRLIFAIPLLCLLVASGITLAGAWLRILLRRLSPRLDRPLIPAGLAAAVLVATAWVGWQDYRISPAESHDARVVAQLAADLPALRESGRDAAYVRGGNDQVAIEVITVAGYRLDLNGDYEFVDLSAGERPAPADGRPALYSGGLLDRITIPDAIPALCDAVYYVQPFALDRFQEIAGDGLPGCTEPPRLVTLPD